MKTGEDIKIFTLKNIILMLSNLLLILSNAIIFFDGIQVKTDNTVEDYISQFLGFGCFFSWLSVLSILSGDKRFNLVKELF